MKFHVVAVAVLVWMWLSPAHAQCNIRVVSNKSCIADVLCYGNIQLKTYRPPLCPSIKQTHIRLKLRGPSVPAKRSCDPFSEHILWMVISKNGWTELPLHVLRCSSKLQDLNASNNRISNLRFNPLYNVTELRYLDLSINKISGIPKDYFKYNKKLKRLVLAQNMIEEIPGGTFATQSTLDYLDLSQNKLITLESNSFGGLKTLKVLRLNGNKLILLNGAIKHLDALKHLYLQHNKLHNVNIQEIPQYSQLQTIDMTNNLLSSVNPGVLSLQPQREATARLRVQDQGTSPKIILSKILLAKNKIVVLQNASFDATTSNIVTRSTPNDVEEFQKSQKRPIDIVPTEIDLSFNMIEKIEYDAFTGISLLIALDLSDNKLTAFIVNTTNLGKLEKLDLHNNDINTIDVKTFHYLNNLKVLRVGVNSIKILQEKSYWSPKGLEILDLSYNRLQELTGTGLGPMYRLRSLQASNNNVSSVSLNGETELSVLQVLSLSCNNIKNMSLVRLRLLELQVLDLSENNITEIPQEAFSETSALRRLDLSKNNIGGFESGSFGKLGRLMSLDLSDNRISDVDYGSFSGLVSLQRLDLSRNRLGALDSRVLYDLHVLQEINLDDNELSAVDTSAWTGRSKVIVTLGGNNLSCSWLESRLEEERRDWPAARLATRVRRGAVSLRGIDCKPTDPSASSPFDDRLLAVNQNILQAILLQTQELKKVLKMLPRAKNLQNQNKTSGR